MADQLSTEQQKQLDDLIYAGRKIDAIKLWREITRADLLAAKNAVEARETQLREQTPQAFTPRKSGCFSAIVLAMGGLAMLGWAITKVLA